MKAGADVLALPLLVLGLALMAVWAMGVGSSEIGMARVVQALYAPTGDRVDLVVATVRLPRVLAAVVVGAALAVAGAIMQAVTANPLAEPGLLGVNAGAAFAVVVAIAFFGVTATGVLVWAAFAGAATAAAIVYTLGARVGAGPIRIVLAGVVVTTFLGAVTSAILILDVRALDAVRLWTAGTLSGRRMTEIAIVLPYLLPALGLSLLVARHFTAMSLGAEAAAALGQHPMLWRGAAALLVVALAGSAVAIAGPLGFVGLVAPHLARGALGADYRRALPFAMVAGAALTLAADTLPRAALGRDVPVGVTLALVGAPLLVWLARRRRG